MHVWLCNDCRTARIVTYSWQRYLSRGLKVAGIEQVLKVMEGWRQDSSGLHVQVQSHCCDILARLATLTLSAELEQVGKRTIVHNTTPYGMNLVATFMAFVYIQRVPLMICCIPLLLSN